MRVLIQADMEGVSDLADYRELVACWPEFWRSGRARLTADVAAAASGLLAGGATAVAVEDGHGSGAPNILAAALPHGVALLGPDEATGQLRARAFDAVFQVGRHARCGTNDAFAPHTRVLGLAVALDGKPLTESHLDAWRAGVPLLGITGDDKLARQLDGPLAGVPFLAVKHSRGRAETRPRYPTAAAAGAAIRDFAATCARGWRSRPTGGPAPAGILLASFHDPDGAARVAGRAGWSRAGRSGVHIRVGDWWRDAEPALAVAARATIAPLLPVLGRLDLASEGGMSRADPGDLAWLARWFEGWLERPEPARWA